MSSSPRFLSLSDGALPTEDLYVTQAVPFLKQQGIHFQRIDASHCSPWRAALGKWVNGQGFKRAHWEGAHVLITRSLPAPWIHWLQKNRPQLGRIFYLVDDDFEAASHDHRLPSRYRQRMARFSSEMQPSLLALADEVIVCSAELRQRMRYLHDTVSVLTPSLMSPLPCLDHQHSASIDIGFHGTRAHAADLEAIAPALNNLLQEQPQLNLEVMLGKHVPGSLDALPRVSTPPALGWHDFLTYQRSRRLHIGIAPLWPTPFNTAKSWIKFLDIAVMGGVGIYSKHSPYTEVVEHGVTGLLVEDSIEAWHEALMELVIDTDRRADMARIAAERALKVGDPTIAQSFWLQRLQ